MSAIAKEAGQTEKKKIMATTRAIRRARILTNEQHKLEKKHKIIKKQKAKI